MKLSTAISICINAFLSLAATPAGHAVVRDISTRSFARAVDKAVIGHTYFSPTHGDGEHAHADHGDSHEAHGAEHGHHDDAHAHEESHEEHGAHHGHHDDTHAHEEAPHDKHDGVLHHVGGHSSVHDHDSSDTVAASLALSLMGTVGWMMFLVYFINFPDPDVVQATWDTLGTMIAIFCAVLVFSASQEVLIDFAGGTQDEHDAHGHGPPGLFDLVFAYVRFGFFLLGMQLIFHYYRARPKPLKYCTSLGCHIVGFAAIDAFGNTLQLEFFATSITLTFSGIMGAVLVLLTIFHLLSLLRERSNGSEEWLEECSESDSDSVGLAVGLLLSMMIRFAITGHLPPVHGAPKYKTFEEVWTLFGVALCIGPAVIFVGYARKRWVHHDCHWMVKTGFETLERSLSMTMGWALLFWGYWEFYSAVANQDAPGGKMSQRIIMALVFSAIVFGSIVGIDFIADKVRASSMSEVEEGLRGLLKTMALLMGLSWEAAFTQATHAVAHQHHGEMRKMVTVGMSLALCALVLPAWAWYILPNTTQGKDVGNVTPCESSKPTPRKQEEEEVA